ncbi:MAG: 2Fe-2S iron-sulfur cluster binding domain-containing protein [Novosphingobium sp.]|nr:2Fe-2S iron-sulfur cluster binding domain-containing protein [Novosphingobium sp.]
MVKITFVEANGREHAVESPAGISLMEAAQSNGVPGIVADCGGNCSCGTCRVFVDTSWYAKTGGPNELEADMLDMHDDHRECERLSCQITLSDDLDGLVVSLPESQF